MEFRRQENALKREEFETLRDELLKSPLISRSQLNGSFQTSRGFGIVFTEAGRSQVISKFPVLTPFFDVIGFVAEQTLHRWWSRTQVPRPNAWYLNVLLVGGAEGIAPHIDATLAKPAGRAEATPRVVSVLYLQVPNCRGGELVLARDKKLVGIIQPKKSMMVHFRGDLEHQVRKLEGAQSTDFRASLVLEQYCFDEQALAALPAFHVQSRAKFELALQQARERGRADFELEPREVSAAPLEIGTKSES